MLYLEGQKNSGIGWPSLSRPDRRVQRRGYPAAPVFRPRPNPFIKL